MTRAIVVDAHGGPEALRMREVEVAHPGPGEIRIRHHAIGVNFIDVYQRSGLYAQKLPFIAGNEGAGEVVALGPDVTDLSVGDRVAYQGATGSYAEERIVRADQVVPLPDAIDYETAAAVLLKGVTAYYLLFETWPVKAGETILAQAAAGGVGTILCQWANHLGARVIGTAGSPEKVALALRNGCHEAIDYSREDFVARVKQITGGRGVDVVYDGVGQATFERSLDCLRPRGLMVSFGNASGPVSIPNLGVLSTKGSLYVTRPITGTYLATPEQRRTAAGALFDAIAAGHIEVSITRRLPLEQAAEAHRGLEARETTGSTVLIP